VKKVRPLPPQNPEHARQVGWIRIEIPLPAFLASLCHSERSEESRLLLPSPVGRGFKSLPKGEGPSEVAQALACDSPPARDLKFRSAFLAFVSSRARSTSLRAGSAEGPGSFSTPADAPPTTDQAQCIKAQASFGCSCHSARLGGPLRSPSQSPDPSRRERIPRLRSSSLPLSERMKSLP
jgi:hypothetical protein